MAFLVQIGHENQGLFFFAAKRKQPLQFRMLAMFEGEVSPKKPHRFAAKVCLPIRGGLILFMKRMAVTPQR